MERRRRVLNMFASFSFSSFPSVFTAFWKGVRAGSVKDVGKHCHSLGQTSGMDYLDCDRRSNGARMNLISYTYSHGVSAMR